MQVTCNGACMRAAGIPHDASIVSIQDVWSNSDDDTSGELANGLQRSSFTFYGSSGTDGSTLDGPGRIETVLDSNGGSAFLIIEHSESDISDLDLTRREHLVARY